MRSGRYRLRESFQSSGRLHFDNNGECHDRRDIANVWMSVCKYPKDEETKVVDGTTYLYCIALTDSWSSHFWAVYPGNDNPRDAENRLPAYLVKEVPVSEESYLVYEDEEDNEDSNFRPTKEWMEEKFKEFNKTIFDGTLTDCELDVFTSGRGSEGKTLGRFSIQPKGVYIYKRLGRLFRMIGGSPEYIYKRTFVETCHPKIELNANYTGKESAFENTLVHEMCHLFTYMNGYVPKQAHGREFKDISHDVQILSHGRFTITRIASAEVMSDLKLDDEMEEKRKKRTASMMKGVTAVFVITQAKVEMTLTKSEDLISRICMLRAADANTKRIFHTKDPEIINTVVENGFRHLMRTWKFWNVKEQKWWPEVRKLLDTKGVKTYDINED